MLNKVISILSAIAFVSSSFAGIELFYPANSWLWNPLLDIGLPFIVGSVTISGILIASLLSGILQDRKMAICAVVGFSTYLIFIDVNLLQPYNYIYLIILILSTDRNLNSSQLLQILAIFMAGIYVWSGVHKFNPQYVDFAFKDTFHGLWLCKGWSEQMWLTGAHGSALAEVILGLFLVFRITRIPAAILIGAMHLIIVWTLGPFGLNWNPTVWPWNIYMTVLLFILAIHQLSKRRGNPNKVKTETSKWVLGSVIIIAWFLPILGEIQFIPSTLGWNLYSANEPYGYVCLDRKPQSSDLQKGCLYDKGQVRFYVNYFYINKTNTGILPTEQNITRVFESVKSRNPELANLDLKFGSYYYNWDCD